MYYRFVQSLDKARPNNEGPFQTAYYIRNRYGDEELDGMMGWFDHHLVAPKRFKREAIFWYREYSKCVRPMFRMAQILSRYGVQIACYTTEDPGTIVYEDKHQVAALYKRRTKCRPVEIPEERVVSLAA